MIDGFSVNVVKQISQHKYNHYPYTAQFTFIIPIKISVICYEDEFAKLLLK